MVVGVSRVHLIEITSDMDQTNDLLCAAIINNMNHFQFL